MKKTKCFFKSASFPLFVTFFAECGGGGGSQGGDMQVLGTQLLYTSNVTVNEAEKLAEFLVESNFAKEENENTIQLDKDGNKYLFRMVVKVGIEDDPEMVEVFKEYAAHISNFVFDKKPVDFHICDNQLQTRMVVSG